MAERGDVPEPPLQVWTLETFPAILAQNDSAPL